MRVLMSVLGLASMLLTVSLKISLANDFGDRVWRDGGNTYVHDLYNPNMSHTVDESWLEAAGKNEWSNTTLYNGEKRDRVVQSKVGNCGTISFVNTLLALGESKDSQMIQEVLNEPYSVQTGSVIKKYQLERKYTWTTKYFSNHNFDNRVLSKPEGVFKEMMDGWKRGKAYEICIGTYGLPVDMKQYDGGSIIVYFSPNCEGYSMSWSIAPHGAFVVGFAINDKGENAICFDKWGEDVWVSERSFTNMLGKNILAVIAVENVESTDMCNAAKQTEHINPVAAQETPVSIVSEAGLIIQPSQRKYVRRGLFGRRVVAEPSLPVAVKQEPQNPELQNVARPAITKQDRRIGWRLRARFNQNVTAQHKQTAAKQEVRKQEVRTPEPVVQEVSVKPIEIIKPQPAVTKLPLYEAEYTQQVFDSAENRAGFKSGGNCVNVAIANCCASFVGKQKWLDDMASRHYAWDKEGENPMQSLASIGYNTDEFKAQFNFEEEDVFGKSSYSLAEWQDLTKCEPKTAWDAILAGMQNNKRYVINGDYGSKMTGTNLDNSEYIWIAGNHAIYCEGFRLNENGEIVMQLDRYGRDFCLTFEQFSEAFSGLDGIQTITQK